MQMLFLMQESFDLIHMIYLRINLIGLHRHGRLSEMEAVMVPNLFSQMLIELIL